MLNHDRVQTAQVLRINMGNNCTGIFTLWNFIKVYIYDLCTLNVCYVNKKSDMKYVIGKFRSREEVRSVYAS